MSMRVLPPENRRQSVDTVCEAAAGGADQLPAHVSFARRSRGASAWQVAVAACLLLGLAGCGEKKTELGEGGSEISGSAGPAGAQNASLTLARCDLGPGTYLVDVAIHARNGTPYDYWRGACRFRVDSPRTEAGVWAPERSWAVEGGATWART